MTGGLLPGDVRLLADIGQIDDRGLKVAEAICHAQRHRDERLFGAADVDTLRAIDALDGVRRLTKREA